ncbi:PaaI family thioesterase [Geomicrobium sp. JCM 19055]|uniref:PaaI family thioesterase n=1 Tax=Geomicrobium sp. JCM 19055 TaxID=1460649 RepID=UPI00045ECD10|nr:PaaI family thioesterase [Geomicrobium sp. JCM 19055]GAK00559.1 hypothetical protein JCM19055_3655 [Geomicrobium sp. JCM 19055]
MKKQLLEEHEESLMKNNRFRELLGIQIKEVVEGRAILELPFNENLLQSANMLHGGVLSILVDSVIGTAIRSVLNEKTIAITAEMNINYFRPAMKGTLRAEGKVLNKGNTIAVGTANIYEEDGKIVATGRATYVVKKMPV